MNGNKCNEESWKSIRDWSKIASAAVSENSKQKQSKVLSQML